MALQKTKIEIHESDMITFDFHGQSVTMMQSLNATHQIILSSEYLSSLFDQADETGISERFFISEYALIMQIIDIVSSVEVSGLDIDSVISSGLWDQIKRRIINYDAFRYDLSKVILLYQHESNQKKLLGSVVEKALDKLYTTLDNISGLDAEEFRSVAKEFTDNLEALNDSLPGLLKGQPAKKSGE